jgi:Zn-dependent M28 family amino/carboxypeptidase
MSGVLLGCRPSGPEHFDGDLAFEHVVAQMEIGPRHPGSRGGERTGDYIVRQLRRLGWEVQEQRFEYKGVDLRNIVGVRGEGPAVLFGAHYDTRPLADHDPDPTRRDEPVPGANDGASGVAVLLELARVLARVDLDVEVRLAFFDAEDSGQIDGWRWCVGSSYMARNLPEGTWPEYVVIVDMIGDADQQVFWEHNSDPLLQSEIWDLADELGYGEVFSPTYRYAIMDDHVPFIQEGLRAVDLIDFDYPYWHTVADTIDKVSPLSLERVGRILEEMVRRKLGLTGQ